MDKKEISFFPSWRDPSYYFFMDDVRKYPDAWLYVVWSRRGPGKTYSFLRSMYEDGIKFAYMKRTLKDVERVCTNKYDIDLSPFVPINRDTGSTVHPRLLSDGIGGFYKELDEKGEPTGNPIGYVLALNAIKDIKGLELSDADFICLDEFIPQLGERVSRQEGEMLLSIYMTAMRDRIKRGKGPIKLVLFANAENIATPVTSELEIIDSMAELQATGKTHLYDEDRGILLHHITEDEIPIKAEEKSGIFRAMGQTAWGRKAFGGEFASNDFTNIGRQQLKGFRPVCSVFYRNAWIYVYRSSGQWYLSTSRHDAKKKYNLERENDQKAFYFDYVIDIREACIDDKARFQKYTFYDLIINYKKIYKVTA